MTGKVLDSGTNGILVLILPLSVALVLLFAAWQWLLLLIVLIVGWKVWRYYQWQQWSQQVNPFFNQLIRENRGLLTPLDLSLKANLTGRAAKRFLERKAEEFGAQRKGVEGEEIAYYFLTASALGTIFDDSEPVLEGEENNVLPSEIAPHLAGAVAQAVVEAPSALSATVEPESVESSPALERATITPETLKSPSNSSVAVESPPVEQTTTPDSSQSTSTLEEPPAENKLEEFLSKASESSQDALKMDSSEVGSLIQADLAKRLDINASTIARRKADPDFSQWSQSKDPDGIAWRYVPRTKMFVPLDPK